MKKPFQILTLLALLILAGCQKEKVSYQSDVAFYPTDEKDIYKIDFKLTKLGYGDKKQLLISPTVEVVTGKEALVQGGNEKNTIQFKAIITNTNGSLKASSTVSVIEDGKQVWSASQTVSLSQ